MSATRTVLRFLVGVVLTVYDDAFLFLAVLRFLIGVVLTVDDDAFLFLALRFPLPV